MVEVVEGREPAELVRAVTAVEGGGRRWKAVEGGGGGEGALPPASLSAASASAAAASLVSGRVAGQAVVAGRVAGQAVVVAGRVLIQQDDDAGTADKGTKPSAVSVRVVADKSISAVVVMVVFIGSVGGRVRGVGARRSTSAIVVISNPSP